MVPWFEKPAVRPAADFGPMVCDRLSRLLILVPWFVAFTVMTVSHERIEKIIRSTNRG